MADTITTLDIYGDSHEVPLDSLFWRPSAYGIVIHDGSVLLLKLQRGYELPGGGIDIGEMPEACAIREVKEETGLDAANPKLVAVASNFFTFTHVDNSSFQSLLIFYACEYVGGEISNDGFDEYEKQYTEQAEWVPLDKLDDLKIASSLDFRPYVRQVAGQI